MSKEIMVIARQTLKVGADRYVARGELCKLDAEEAEDLARRGIVEMARGQKAPAKNEGKKPKGKTLVAALVKGIHGLNPVEDFTANGVPNLHALSMALGYPVEESERDAAFTAYLEENPEGPPALQDTALGKMMAAAQKEDPLAAGANQAGSAQQSLT